MQILESLNTRVFETRTATGRDIPRRAKTVLSPRFLYYSSLTEKTYLVMWMWLCEGELKEKIAHLRLPSAS